MAEVSTYFLGLPSNHRHMPVLWIFCDRDHREESLSTRAEKGCILKRRLVEVSRHVDHTKRAFRLEERPLLAKDWARRLEADKKDHAQNGDDGKGTNRFARMLNDHNSVRRAISGNREEEYAVKKEAARIIMEAEMVERREQVLKQREAEEKRQRRRQEEADDILADLRALEQEIEAESREEEAAADAEKEAREKALREREQELAKIAAEAKRKLQREEEALARRNAARLAPAAPADDNVWRPRISLPSSSVGPVSSRRPPWCQGSNACRPPGARGSEALTDPSPPIALPLSRQEAAHPLNPSQRPAGRPWRERMLEQEAAAASSVAPNGRDRPQTAAPTPKPAEDGGAGRGVWKPRHLRDKT